MNERVKSVCVVGAGSAGFISAVTLKRMLPELDVTVVYSSKLPVIGVGESTTDIFPRFLHHQLQLDRHRFFEEVRPSWKLGVRFEWGAKEVPHFNYGFDQVFSARIPPMRKCGAFYCLDAPVDSGYFWALMDRSQSPLVIAPNGQYNLLPGGAYHIPNQRFLNYMLGIARELGVRFVDGTIEHVTQDDAGNVASVNLKDGHEICADLFIDCSGFESLLLDKTLGESYVSYSNTLVCDRAVIGSWQRNSAILPYTTSQTMNHGWCWRIEFEDIVTRGYVYSSQFCSDDEAIEELKLKNPELTGDLRAIKFPSGRYENFWVRNVIAIGNASGFVEPLEATALHLIAVQLSAACAALLDSNCQIVPSVQRAINRQFRTMWDDVRDFLAVHYKFNEKLDTPFWLHSRAETGLGGAQALIDLYQEAGPHRLGEAQLPRESIFRYEGYLTMLIGQRVPTQFRSELNDRDRQDWAQHRQRILSLISNALPVREGLHAVRDPRFQWPKTR
jgi:tryptophan halogenase